MTNHDKYIKNATLDELAEFLLSLTSLLNPSTCEGCPVKGGCKDNEYGGCIGAIKRWLISCPPELSPDKSLDELAAFLGAIGHHIFAENNCQDCPAAKECRERDAENCEQAFRFWLEAEVDAEDDGAEEADAEESTVTDHFSDLMAQAMREQENYLLSVIERYERGEQLSPEYPEYADLAESIIKRYKSGCGCLYCGKSTIPDRSPDKDICTPADCARGLAEYINRMED
jgi:hypothetical protein